MSTPGHGIWTPTRPRAIPSARALPLRRLWLRRSAARPPSRGDAGAEGLVPTTTAFGTALADISRCSACGHGQLDPLPDAAALDSAYADAASDDYLREAVGQQATAATTLAVIERHRPARGRLLDLGCWVGFLLAEARDRGWEVTGVDPSAFATAEARARGLCVHQGDLLTAPLPAHSFDAVVLGDVIEHLVDPGAALQRVAELSAPGAVVCLLLPDAGSRVARVLGRRWWSVIPTHVQYFTRRSLLTLLTRHGFQPLELRTAPKAFTVRYYLERLRGYWPPAAVAATRGAAALGLADRLWAPDFRDRMLVVARTPAGRGILPEP